MGATEHVSTSGGDGALPAERLERGHGGNVASSSVFHHGCLMVEWRIREVMKVEMSATRSKRDIQNPNIKRSLAMKRLFCILTIVFLAGCFPKSDTVATSAPKQEQQRDIFTHSGVYKVGSEIPAGRYFVLAEGGGAYFEIAKDSLGSLDSIISNENITTFGYADLRDGDYFKVNGGKFVLRDSLSDQLLRDPTHLGDGQYLVGRDIAAGEYKLIAGAGGAYWSRGKDARGTLYSILANDNFDGQAYVTVRDGEFLTITGATAEPLK
jgi:hypothetical protein